MTTDLYEQVREKMDRLNHPYFPRSKSGVELKILKKLFTEEEAELYLHMEEKLESAEAIAKRTKQDPRKVAAILKNMTEKGLTIPKKKGDKWYYGAPAFSHGIMDNHVNVMDKETAQLFHDYCYDEKLVTGEQVSAMMKGSVMPLRTIPIKRAIKAGPTIATYEDAEKIIRSKRRIGVTKCIDAAREAMLDSGCKRPQEVCLHFDFYADYMIELGWAREIDKEEALKIVAESEKAGLVHQAANTVDPGALCNCCPECCAAIRMLKTFPNPATLVNANYICEVEADLCNECSLCLDLCPMNAIKMGPEGVAVIDLGYCIGCGLCVQPCPTKALKLAPKPEGTWKVPPPFSSIMRASEDWEKTLTE